jgi:hypothetical protein
MVTEGSKKAGWLKPVAALAICAVAVVGFSVLFRSAFSPGSSFVQGLPLPGHRAGDATTLRNGTVAPNVPVFLTQRALNELRTAWRDETVNVLLVAGEAFTVDQGTRVLILEVGTDTTRIRILSGSMIGRTGFVPTDWCGD